jgi:hypothetical protein
MSDIAIKLLEEHPAPPEKDMILIRLRNDLVDSLSEVEAAPVAEAHSEPAPEPVVEPEAEAAPEAQPEAEAVAEPVSEPAPEGEAGDTQIMEALGARDGDETFDERSEE